MTAITVGCVVGPFVTQDRTANAPPLRTSNLMARGTTWYSHCVGSGLSYWRAALVRGVVVGEKQEGIDGRRNRRGNTRCLASTSTSSRRKTTARRTQVEEKLVKSLEVGSCTLLFTDWRSFSSKICRIEIKENGAPSDIWGVYRESGAVWWQEESDIRQLRTRSRLAPDLLCWWKWTEDAAAGLSGRLHRAVSSGREKQGRQG